MGAPDSFTIYELDENLEVAGRRTVQARQTVIPITSPPEELCMLKVDISAHFSHVTEMQIGWFDAEDADYALANDSLWYLEVTFGISGTTEKQSENAWQLFREKGTEALAQRLGLSSWGIGRGIVSRRGQALFFVELDGLDSPQWILFRSVGTSDTYDTCWKTAEVVEHFVSNELARWIKANMC